ASCLADLQLVDPGALRGALEPEDAPAVDLDVHERLLVAEEEPRFMRASWDVPDLVCSPLVHDALAGHGHAFRVGSQPLLALNLAARDRIPGDHCVVELAVAEVEKH